MSSSGMCPPLSVTVTPSASLSAAVQGLENLQSQVAQEAPELTNEYNHLVSVGQGLEAGRPTQAQITSYVSALQSFANVLNAPDTELQSEIENIASDLVNAANDIDPIARLVPGNPLGPPPISIYWTGLFILAGCVVGAAAIRKVRK